jgi:hypothetical protein
MHSCVETQIQFLWLTKLSRHFSQNEKLSNDFSITIIEEKNKFIIAQILNRFQFENKLQH